MGKYTEALKDNLRRILRSKQITMKELSFKSKLSTQSIYKYKSDKSHASPTLKNLEAIAQALKMTPMELITPKEKRNG